MDDAFIVGLAALIVIAALIVALTRTRVGNTGDRRQTSRDSGPSRR